MKKNMKMIQDEETQGFGWLSRQYETDLLNGLTTLQSSRRLKNNGFNSIDSTFMQLNVKIWKKLTNWVNVCHILCGFVFLCIYFLVQEGSDTEMSMYLGIICISYILLVVLLELLLQYNHVRILGMGNGMIKNGVIIWRDGRRIQVNKKNLVVGDVIQVFNGQEIPADIYLVDCRCLVSDQYPITGDHKGVGKQVGEEGRGGDYDVKNMLFCQTYCVEGWGKGVVIRTGRNTLFGQIRAVTNKRGKKFGQSLLQKQKRLMDLLKMRMGIFMGLLMLLGGIYMSRGLIESIQMGLFVFILNLNSCMRLGLDVILMGCLQRLGVGKVLLQNKNSLYGVSRCEYLCSDRTAVMTENNLELVYLWYDGVFRRADNRQKVGKNYDFEYDVNDGTFKILQEGIVSITQATFNKDYKQRHRLINYYECQLIGDNFDGALIRFIQPIVDVEEMRGGIKYGKKKEGTSARLPYNSSRKYQLCIVKKKSQGSDYTVYVMGVGENVWGMCGYVMMGDRNVEITKQDSQNFKRICIERAANGEKPIGVAMLRLESRKFPKGHRFNMNLLQFSLQGLVFIGGLFLNDPLNMRSMQTLIRLQDRGIKNIILSSQVLEYTEHMLKQLKISNVKTNLDLQKEGMGQFQAINNSDYVVFNSRLLVQKPELLRLLISKSLLFFSQVTTSLKQQILKFYQTQGLLTYVAGRNTSEILQADILIANGIQVRKGLMNKADIVLADDRFENIEVIVKQSLRIGVNLGFVLGYSFWRGFVGGILGMIWLFYGVFVGDMVGLLLVLTFGQIIPIICLCFEFNGETKGKMGVRKGKGKGKGERGLVSFVQIGVQLLLSILVVLGSFVRYSRFQGFYWTYELYLLEEVKDETLQVFKGSYTVSIYILSILMLYVNRYDRKLDNGFVYNYYIFVGILMKILFVFIFMDGFGVFELHLWYLIIFVFLVGVFDGVFRVVRWFVCNLGLC